jgi:hypothetical protein
VRTHGEDRDSGASQHFTLAHAVMCDVIHTTTTTTIGYI